MTSQQKQTSVVQAADEWLQSGGLLYRLTDERRPQNRDEVNVTMVDGSRDDAARTARATELLDLISGNAASREVRAVDKSRADALTDEQIDKIADEVIKRVAGERISYGQACRFTRAILAAAPTPPADAAAGRLRDGTPLDKSVVHRLAVQMGIIPADAAAAPGDERAVEEAGVPTGIYDGDTPESRAAFRDYDRRELVRTRSKWQVWRDACAWQASAAVSQSAAPADERAALTSGGYFVYDPAGNYFERFDTDTERDAAHRDAINEYRREAQYDQEWSEDVDQIISGIVTHTTGELKVDEGCYDYAPRAAAAQPETKPTEAEILDLIYECNLGGATEQQAMDFANRLLNF